MVPLFGPRARRFPTAPRPTGHHEPVPTSAELTARARAVHNPTGVRVV
ncbi:hypothetical protein [Nocardioides mangrovicus]|nr:hypothetical protein [Nocardioides mangrovicus]